MNNGARGFKAIEIVKTKLKEFADFEATHKIEIPCYYKDFMLANGVERFDKGPLIKCMKDRPYELVFYAH